MSSSCEQSAARSFFLSFERARVRMARPTTHITAHLMTARGGAMRLARATGYLKLPVA